MASYIQKKNLFNAGATAFAAISRPRIYRYVCPVCLRGFEDHNSLTLEHVPPKSIGGKVLCLTCRECNNQAGHGVDAAVHGEATLHSFLVPGNDPVRATLAADGATVRVEVERDDAGTQIQVVGNASNPASVEHIKTYLVRLQG